MSQQPLKETVVFKGVFSKQASKGHNIVVRTLVMACVLTAISIAVFYIYDTDYPVWFPTITAGLSVLFYYAKEQRWTIQVVDRETSEGNTKRILDVVHHRHLLNVFKWNKEVYQHDLALSSLRLYREHSSYMLLHRSDKEAYPIVRVRRAYRQPFKSYCNKFLKDVYACDPSRNVKKISS